MARGGPPRSNTAVQTPRTTVVNGLVVVTLLVLGRTVFDATFTLPYETADDNSNSTTGQQDNRTPVQQHNSTKSDIHSSSTSSKTKRHNKGTLLIFEKVQKTGTTSLEDHLYEAMNVDDGKYWDDADNIKAKENRGKNTTKEFCYRISDGFVNKTNPEFYPKWYQDHFWSDTQIFPPCSCETDVFLSHMSRIPEKLEEYLGTCDWTNVDVLSVIPLRFDRIHSEIQYGHNNLCLDPTKSILDNCEGYKFNPYDQYGHNPLATRTCVFNFLDRTFHIPHSKVTAKVRGEDNGFECTTKVCEDSIEFVKREEAKHIQQLQEKFPVCDVEELHSLLLLQLKDTGPQEEEEAGKEENNRTLSSQRKMRRRVSVTN